MQRIAIDMDGVISDTVAQFIKYHEEEFGEKITIDAVNGMEEFNAFPGGRKHIFTEGFFRTAPVMKDSQKVVQELNSRYEIFIVSAATEFPLSLSEKQAWLNEHFPFITWQQMVFCGSKTIIQADVMIDDHFKNLDHFPGKTFLFSQPHNRLKPEEAHHRVDSWEEIAGLFL